MRKKVMAVVFAVLAFSLIAASAATLGGITVADVGADAELVASCDDDGVDVSFGPLNYNGATGNYETTTVTVAGINDVACDGKTIQVTLSNLAGDVFVSNTGTVSGPSITLNAAYDAEALRRVVVAISG